MKNLTKHLPNLAPYNNNNNNNNYNENKRVRRELKSLNPFEMEQLVLKKDILEEEDEEEEADGKKYDVVVENNVEKYPVINTVSLLMTRDMNESLIIDDLTTNKPTAYDYEEQDEDEEKKYNVVDVTEVAEKYNSRAIKEQPNVNQETADIHMTYNVNDKNKNENNQEYEEKEEVIETITTMYKYILQNEGEQETTTWIYNQKEVDEENVEITTITPTTMGKRNYIKGTASNEIKKQKETRFNAQNLSKVVAGVEEVQKSNFTKENNSSTNNNNNNNYADNGTITKQQQEKLSKKLLKTSMSLYKDIEEKEQHEQQQIKMQMYNNNNNNKNNDSDNNNNINIMKDNDVAANQYLNFKKQQESSVKDSVKIFKENNSTILAETDMETTLYSLVTETVNEANIVGKTKKIYIEYNDNKDVGHNADNYWSRSNRVDNLADNNGTLTTTETSEGVTNMNVIVNNFENNTIDDGYLIATTTAKQEEENEAVNKDNVHKMMELDKFILNDRQIDITTIEKVEQNLMEINEQMLIVNSTEQRMKLNVNVNKDMNEDDEDDGKEVGKLTPQHLMLDELMLNDAGVEGPTEFVKKRKTNEISTTKPYISNNDVLNYIDNENEDIDIVNLEDKDNKQRHQQPVPTDELFYKTLPAPKVVESFDKPNKRILVNVTIATDDADGSVYTLHVAVPSGRGKNDEKNIEQILTHERRRHTQLNDAKLQSDTLPASPYCYPEPPPTIPDCPCTCADYTLTNDIDHDNDLDKYVRNNLEMTTTTTTIPIDTTFLTTTQNQNVHLTKHDNDTDIDTTTIANMGVGNTTTTTTTLSTACPDVMPILILEGVCCFICIL